jgi:phosphatidylglycerol:prolipoprotein diacylglycerol transferase
MYPILFEYGRLTVFTYGVLVALGFTAALWLGRYEARRAQLSPRRFTDLALVSLVAAIVGARALYVVIELNYFATNPVGALELWRGGMVFYGGFCVAYVAGALFLRMTHTPLRPMMDAAAPAIVLGHAIGRLGCFFTGCCYGSECSLPWAVTFTDPRGLAMLWTPLHPTQLYDALANLVILVILLRMRRPKPHGDGRVFGTYLILYPFMRMIIEVFRDDQRGFIGPFSTSQLIGIPLIILGIIILCTRNRGSAAARI